jgi:pimeloyl-ACP methyl ester carboxylesterase
MLALRIIVGLGLAYVLLLVLAWLLQERLAFPAPRAGLPDPKLVGVANGERVELVSTDGTKLVGWYLAPQVEEVGGGRGRLGEGVPHRINLPQPPPTSPTSPTSPGLLWFYGNGETIALIWPVVREFQPPGTAVLVIDYPGYGGSGGRATEAALYAAGDAAYAALAARPDVDPQRIYVYGRSLGSAVATHTAARRPVAGLILESPFTNAAAMAKHHYWLVPRFLLRLSLDNLANVKRVHCPTLLFHGDADRLVPTAMGMAVAAAVVGPVEVVLIHGAGHNDTYDTGGRAYRDKVWGFIGRTGRPSARPPVQP